MSIKSRFRTSKKAAGLVECTLVLAVAGQKCAIDQDGVHTTETNAGDQTAGPGVESLLVGYTFVVVVRATTTTVVMLTVVLFPTNAQIRRLVITLSTGN